MHPSQRLTQLRYGLATAFVCREQTDGLVTPGLHHLLPVPIRERLILLAKIDGADARTIRAILPVSREDAEGTSPEMVFAIRIWQQTLEDAYWSLPERHGWRRQRNVAVERSLSQLLWADVAVALIGDATLPAIDALPLRKRLILYLLLVHHADWATITELMHASNWEIRQAILQGLAATGGCHVQA
jgi:hypothetical protein